MATLADLVLEAPQAGEGEALTSSLRLVVQIAVPESGGARYGIDIYDDGDGSDSVYSSGYEWLDLSDRVRGTTWRRGKGALVDQPETGVWTVDLANGDGYLSPRNSASGFPSIEALAPGTPMRVGYWDDSLWSPAFTGIIEDIDEAAVELDADVWATFTVIETVALLARLNRPEQPAAGASEHYRDRFERLLADAGWPYGANYLGVTALTAAELQATTMAENRLSELKLTADSIFADIYSGKNGQFTVTTKGTVTVMSSPNLDLFLISDEDGPTTIAAVDFDAIHWAEAPRIKTNADRLVNSVSAARVGGTSITSVDPESIGDNFEVTYKRTDLILDDDADVTTWTAAYLALAKAATVKISDVRLDAAMSAFTEDLLRALDVTSFCYLLRQWRRYPAITTVRYGIRIIGYTIEVTPNHPGLPSWRASLSVDVASFAEV